MPYYPPKERRLYMTLEEVNAILKNYFDRWFKADVKYDKVDGYYYELTCPVCKDRREDGLWEEWKGKIENSWITCFKCESRFGIDIYWYTDNKVEYRFISNSDSTVLNIKVLGYEDAEGNEFWPIFVDDFLAFLKKAGITIDDLIKYEKYQGK